MENEFMRPVSLDGQKAVLKAFIEQPDFYRSVRKMATPEVFGNDLSLRHLMRMIVDGEKKYNKVPSYTDLDIMISQEHSEGRCNDIEFEIIKEVIQELQQDKYLVDMSLAKQIVTTNFKTLQMIKVGNTALRLAKDGDVSYEAQRKVKEEMEKFEGYDDEDFGSNPWDDIDDVLNEDEEEHITTGLPELDNITNGGLEKGCVGVVISRSGGGKTTMSSYMANRAALAGKVVVQIVFEDKETAIHRKHYAAMTGLRINDFTSGKVAKDVKEKVWRAGGAMLRQNLIVKRMINQRTTVDDIFNFVSAVETARGQVVDEIFIDYFDVDGKIQSSTEINASNLTWQKKFTQTKFPTRFGAQVRMVPKSNLSGVPEDASFNLDGVIKLKGDLISTTGKTRKLERESLIKRHGIEPHNGRSYKQTLRYEIKANGDSESFTTWIDE